jgi:hypothetical protein
MKCKLGSANRAQKGKYMKYIFRTVILVALTLLNGLACAIEENQAPISQVVPNQKEVSKEKSDGNATEPMPLSWRDNQTIEIQEIDTDIEKKFTNKRIFRFSRFTSGEYIYEIESNGTDKKCLFVLPTINYLYYGLTDAERREEDSGSLTYFYNEIYHDLFVIYQAAFPSGPDAISNGEIKKIVSVPRYKSPVTVITHRIDNHRIRLGVEIIDGSLKKTFNILWDSKKPNPLPDDYSIFGWRHDGPVQVTTLGEARKIKLRKEIKRTVVAKIGPNPQFKKIIYELKHLASQDHQLIRGEIEKALDIKFIGKCKESLEYGNQCELDAKIPLSNFVNSLKYFTTLEKSTSNWANESLILMPKLEKVCVRRGDLESIFAKLPYKRKSLSQPVSIDSFGVMDFGTSSPDIYKDYQFLFKDTKKLSINILVVEVNQCVSRMTLETTHPKN